MRLRPHHLLCTQGYSGKGYSNDFIENMTAITSLLRGDANVIIEIVFSTDDICSKCPKMIGEGLCEDNNKVNRFDKKMIDYFTLEEKCYVYDDLIREINAKITPSILDDICSNCSWYLVSNCKRNICATFKMKQMILQPGEM